MLDGDHYRTAELVNQLMNNAQMKHCLDLIESLKPDLTIQHAKYCYNYKDVIVVEGETVYDAMMEFQKKFYTQRADSLEEAKEIIDDITE